MRGVAFVDTFAGGMEAPEVNVSLIGLPSRSFKVSGHNFLSERRLVMNYGGKSIDVRDSAIIKMVALGCNAHKAA